MAKVLLVSPSFFSTGGIQNLMSAIVDHSEHQFDVMVRSDECEGRNKRHSNCLTRPVDISRGQHHKEMVRLFMTGQWDYDVVYISSLRHVDAAIFPCLVGTKVICHAHGNDLFIRHYSTALNKLILELGIKCTSDFIAISNWTKNQLCTLGVKHKSISLIPNGVNCRRFKKKGSENIRQNLNLSEHKFVLLTVARLVPRKGHKIVIKALPHFKEAAYIIVGSGPEKSTLQQLAREHGVSDRVIFTGYISDDLLPEYYKFCDLYVMPSMHLDEAGSVEGFGLSFLEANACGKASIGTRTGGIASAVKHEQTGLLCEPDLDSFKFALKRLIADRNLRQQLESQSLDWAKEHDWHKIVNRIDSLISK